MIVAIIPALNEEDTIGSVVLRTEKYVNKVIVVDDGSKDDTAKIAQLAGAHVAQHIQNRGKGVALKTGFEIAQSLNADIIVCLDADAQHNPDDIPKIIAPITAGDAEMVIGSRFINEEHKKLIPKYRRLGQRVLTATQNFGSDVKITDSQSGFRAFSGDIIDIFSFGQKGLNVESEMIHDAIDNKIKIIEVPISARYEGLDTSTETPGKHGLGVLNFILRIVRERHPLLFFGVSGAILLIIGLLGAVYSFDFYFRYDNLPFGPSLVASVLILIGMLCIFTGLILNSISGMIDGLTILIRHRESKDLKDTDVTKIQEQPLLNHNRGVTLLEDIGRRNVQRQIALALLRADMSLRNLGEEMIPEPTPLNLSQAGMLQNDREDEKVQLQTPLDLYQNENLFGDIDDMKILGHTPLDLQREEMLSDGIEEMNMQLAMLTREGIKNAARNHTWDKPKKQQEVTNHNGARKWRY